MFLEAISLGLGGNLDCFLVTCCKKVIFFTKYTFFFRLIFIHKSMLPVMFKNESYLKNMIYKFLG